ncbi:hypothetical protein CDV36_008502 [Fusarium kuroshium]|uniref:Beta-xylosidase C-terminal Concanavalin A-like domain-containing protein n=1 Tax=Fusarium kuroshium TaxID=2010991 RepID=A0A3M2S2R8_9HYPO|nr:hypothetical protein CDV36_008502 [Fusarium kuroshium]
MLKTALFAMALGLSGSAASPHKSPPQATLLNFASEDILGGDDGMPPHPLQGLPYGKPLYPVTSDGDGLEMVEAHLSYWEGKYYMYSATWGCGGNIFVYGYVPSDNYPDMPVYPPGDYGADGNCGIKTYSSKDLTNWELVDFYQPDMGVANVTKPLVRYSKANKEYILYMGGDGRRGIYYATSKSPSGPWSNPPGELRGDHLSHDFDVFVGPDDTHYIITDPFLGTIPSADGGLTWDIWVQQLAPDLISTVNTSETITLVRSAKQLFDQNLTLEATGAFYHDGYYYLMFGQTCQNCAGYIYYFYSESPLGPYKDGGYVSRDGCGGQNKGANVLPTPDGGSIVLAGNLGYRTGPDNYVWSDGTQSYVWHGDNHQAASSTYFFPLEFNRDHTLKNYTCPSKVQVPLMGDLKKSPDAPLPYQLDCRVRNWKSIDATYSQPKSGATLEFPVFQRTDNLGPTTNAGPVLNGPLTVTLAYTNGATESFSWAASNISWVPAKISMNTSGKRVSKITLETNATNGCYGTVVQPKQDSHSSYGSTVLGKFVKQQKAELYVYKW